MNIDFTPEAKTTINAMNDHCNKIEAMFGPDHEYTIKANRSLRGALVTMIGLGGRIGKDGDLSLFGSNEFIAYGVNFSRTIVTDPLYVEAMRGMGLDPANFVGTWSVNS